MFSCPHACLMRELGVSEADCKTHCNRNGQSGCSPAVSGVTYQLCGPCKRTGCPTWPSVSECQIGCSN